MNHKERFDQLGLLAKLRKGVWNGVWLFVQNLQMKKRLIEFTEDEMVKRSVQEKINLNAGRKIDDSLIKLILQQLFLDSYGCNAVVRL